MEISKKQFRRWSLVAVVAVGLSLHTPMSLAQTGAQDVGKERRLATALRRLSSPDERKRAEAKLTLLQLGEAAISPLINLARKLDSKYETLGVADRFPCPDGDLAKCEKLHLSHSRLQSDIILLLGDLYATDAVPLLLEILRCRESSFFDGPGPETDALIKMGADAVPQLLAALRRAEESRQINAELLEQRIARVLGRIGDSRALPLLEEIKGELTALIPKAFVTEAIKEIEQKASGK